MLSGCLCILHLSSLSPCLAFSQCDRGNIFQAINFKLHLHTFGVWSQCSIDFQKIRQNLTPWGGGTWENFLIAWWPRVVVILRTPCFNCDQWPSRAFFYNVKYDTYPLVQDVKRGGPSGLMVPPDRASSDWKREQIYKYIYKKSLYLLLPQQLRVHCIWEVDCESITIQWSLS